MKKLIVFLIAILPFLTGATLQELVLSNADKYVNVREIKPNRSPEIDRFHNYVGLPYGNSWCMMFVVYNYKEASDQAMIKNPLPKIARCSLMWKQTKKNPYKYKTINADRVRYGFEKLKPADIIIWSNNRHPGDDNWNGHTGLVVEQLTDKAINTIEGNTSSGSIGNQANGDGVYYRTRFIQSNAKFKIEGFIRVR